MTPRGLDVTPCWCHQGDMELGQYVSDLQRQLVDGAENGAEDTRAVAQRLAAGLDAATRLVLLDVLSAAADRTSSSTSRVAASSPAASRWATARVSSAPFSAPSTSWRCRSLTYCPSSMSP